MQVLPHNPRHDRVVASLRQHIDKGLHRGNRIQFVSDSAAVKTNVPKLAILCTTIDKGNGGSFRVAIGEKLPSLGMAKLKGEGTPRGSPKVIGTQVAEITKTLPSVDEMVNSGIMVITHKKGGIAKRLDPEVDRKIRDLVKGGGGSEAILERAGGSFAFETDV